VEFNYQKYTIKVLGAILLVKLSSLIKIYLGGGGQDHFQGGGMSPLHPPKKPW
jgi:hypothetical protein